MDWSQINISEFLYQGRFHIGGGLIFSVFVVAFVREVVWDLITRRAEKQEDERVGARGSTIQDA